MNKRKDDNMSKKMMSSEHKKKKMNRTCRSSFKWRNRGRNRKSKTAKLKERGKLRRRPNNKEPKKERVGRQSRTSPQFSKVKTMN